MGSRQAARRPPSPYSPHVPGASLPAPSSRVIAGFPSPWIIGWGAKFQAGLRDEDASAATSSEIGEAPRSEPGDAAHAALHAAGHISDDEFTLIGGPPNSPPAVRRPRSPYPRPTFQAPRSGPARGPGCAFRDGIEIVRVASDRLGQHHYLSGTSTASFDTVSAPRDEAVGRGFHEAASQIFMIFMIPTPQVGIMKIMKICPAARPRSPRPDPYPASRDHEDHENLSGGQAPIAPPRPRARPWRRVPGPAATAPRTGRRVGWPTSRADPKRSATALPVSLAACFEAGGGSHSHPSKLPYRGQCLIRVEMAVMMATVAVMILVSASVHQSQRGVSI